MSIATIIIALVLALVAWKVLAGVLRIGAILVIVVLAAFFLSHVLSQGTI
ncbi:hypothetical protein AEB_P2138 [Altererythrobacter sp. B11]|nr:hypothetical protein [Altererythrobacter sp. B11]BBC73006.1 hypothetical protein AEB_P2138 [Altererythrobacter sp. B11]